MVGRKKGSERWGGRHKGRIEGSRRLVEGFFEVAVEEPSVMRGTGSGRNAVS